MFSIGWLIGSCTSPTSTNVAIWCGMNPPVVTYMFSFVPVLAKVLRLSASWAARAAPSGRVTPWFIVYASVWMISLSTAWWQFACGTSSLLPSESSADLIATGVHSTPSAAIVAYTLAIVSGETEVVPPISSAGCIEMSL